MIRSGHAVFGPSACPTCDSGRTQVVGRRDDSLTLVLRCDACGAHFSVPTCDDPTDLPLDAPDRAGQLVAR